MAAFYFITKKEPEKRFLSHSKFPPPRAGNSWRARAYRKVPPASRSDGKRTCRPESLSRPEALRQPAKFLFYFPFFYSTFKINTLICLLVTNHILYHVSLCSALVSLSQNEKCPFQHTKKHVLFGACFFVCRVGSKKGNEKAFLRSPAGSWREVSFAAPTLR